MSDPYSDRELEAMLGDPESDLVERKESLIGYRDPHYDVSPVRGAGLGELQVGRFMDEYLPAAVDPETLAANDRTAEERLAAAKMIAAVDDPVPTVAGLLVLGRRPQHFLPGAYVQFLRIAGREWGGEVVDEARCDGSVADLMRRLDDKLIAHNRTAVDFISEPTEVRRSTYPLGALQQLVRNAVMHRAYDGTNAPVHVYWFGDLTLGFAYGAAATRAMPATITTAAPMRTTGARSPISAAPAATPRTMLNCRKAAT